ncbi:MAG: DUF2911 domain-containing protein [Bacteroidota bacterium]
MTIKKSLQTTLAMLVLGLMTFQSFAQKITMPAPSPLQTLNQKFGLGEVTVEYSRPAAKGRTIFGDVVSFGNVWRTGANGATKITFTDDVKIEGKDVKAGTYAIYSVPNKKSWDIMLYSDLKLGGNVADYKAENEVLRVTVKAMKAATKVESFTINIDNVLSTSSDLVFSWANTAVVVKMTTDIDARVMESIEASMKSEKPEYFKAATYYFENGKDLKKALTWVTKATEENASAYWVMLLKARIEYALNDKVAGKASADKTIELATADQNADYVAMATKLIAANK